MSHNTDWITCEYWNSDNNLFIRKNCTGGELCCKGFGCLASCPVTTHNNNDENFNPSNQPNDDNKDSKYPWYLWVILANVVLALLVVAYFWWRRINARNSSSRHHSHSLPQYGYAAHNAANNPAGGAPKSKRISVT